MVQFLWADARPNRGKKRAARTRVKRICRVQSARVHFNPKGGRSAMSVTDPQMRAEFENLAAAFLRLAEQAEHKAGLIIEIGCRLKRRRPKAKAKAVVSYRTMAPAGSFKMEETVCSHHLSLRTFARPWWDA